MSENKTYRLKVNFFAESGNYAYINLRDQTTPSSHTISREGNGSWQELEIIVTMPAGTTQARVYLYSTVSSVDNTVYYDNIEVVEVTAPGALDYQTDLDLTEDGHVHFVVNSHKNPTDHISYYSGALCTIGRGTTRQLDIWMYQSGLYLYTKSSSHYIQSFTKSIDYTIDVTWKNGGNPKLYVDGELKYDGSSLGDDYFTYAGDGKLEMGRYVGQYVNSVLFDELYYSIYCPTDNKIKEIFAGPSRLDIPTGKDIQANLIRKLINEINISSIKEKLFRFDKDNLFYNGNLEYKNNTNFSSFVYDGTEGFKELGCVKVTSTNSNFSDIPINVCIEKKYKEEVAIKSISDSAKIYLGFKCLDKNKNTISYAACWRDPDKDTTLAADVTSSDNIVYVEPASENWFAVSNSFIQFNPTEDDHELPDKTLRISSDSDSIETITNIALQSEAFDTSPNHCGYASISANATTAPDGTTTADKLVENSDDNYHYTYQTDISISSSTTYNMSVYAKKGERDTLAFYYYDNNSTRVSVNGYFDLTNGTCTGSSGVAIESVGSGWYRCSVPITTGSDATILNLHNHIRVSGSNSYQGDGSSGLYLWGQQVTEGSTLYPYTKTTTSSKDIWKITLYSGYTVGASFSKGTEIGNSSSGASYNYNLASNMIAPTEWTNYSGIIEGVNLYNQQPVYNKFRRGTEYIVFMTLPNYGTGTNTIYFDDFQFYEYDEELNKKNSLTSVDKTITPEPGYLVTMRPDEGKFGGAVAVEEATENLASNPSVEINLDDWEGSYRCSIVRTNETSKFGDYSVKITTDASEADNFFATIASPASKISATVDTTYAFTAYVKTSENVKLEIIEYYDGGYITHWSAYSSGDNSKFERLETIFTTSNETNIEFALRLRGSIPCAKSAIIYVDGVQLEKKSFSTSFVDGSRSAGALDYATDLDLTKDGHVHFVVNSEKEMTDHDSYLNGALCTVCRGTTQQLVLWMKDEGFTYVVNSGVKKTKIYSANTEYIIDITWKDGGNPKLYINGSLEYDGSVLGDGIFTYAGDGKLEMGRYWGGYVNSLLFDELYYSNICPTDNIISNKFHSSNRLPDSLNIINIKAERELSSNLPFVSSLTDIDSKVQRDLESNLPFVSLITNIDSKVQRDLVSSISIIYSNSVIDLSSVRELSTNISLISQTNDINVKAERDLLATLSVNLSISDAIFYNERDLRADIYRQLYPSSNFYPGDGVHPGISDQFVLSKIDIIEITVITFEADISASTLTNDAIFHVVRSLDNNISTTYQITNVDSTVERDLISNIQNVINLTNPIVDIDRELSSNISNSTLTNNSIFYIVRSLESNIPVISSITDIDSTVLRELESNIPVNTEITNVDSTVLRELESNIPVNTEITNVDSTVLRELSATISNDIDFTNPIVDIDRELSASIINISEISDIELIIERNFRADIFRQLYPNTTFYPGNGVYPGISDQFVLSKIDIVEITIRELSSNINISFSTNDAIFYGVRELLANQPFTSQITNIESLVHRDLVANIPVNTEITNVDLDIIRELSTSIENVINLTDPIVDIDREFSSNIQNVINLTDPIVDIDREFNTSIPINIDSTDIQGIVERDLKADIFRQVYPENDYYPGEQVFPGIADQFVCSNVTALETTGISLTAQISIDFNVENFYLGLNHEFEANISFTTQTSNIDEILFQRDITSNIPIVFSLANPIVDNDREFSANIQSEFNLNNFISSVERDLSENNLCNFSLSNAIFYNERDFRADIFRQLFPNDSSYPGITFYPGISDQFVLSKIDAIEVTEKTLNANIQLEFSLNNPISNVEHNLSTNISFTTQTSDINAIEVTDRPLSSEVIHTSKTSNVDIEVDRELETDISIEFDVSEIEATETTSLTFTANSLGTFYLGDLDCSVAREFSSSINNNFNLSDTIFAVKREFRSNIFKQLYPGTIIYPSDTFYPGFPDQFVCSDITVFEITGIGLSANISIISDIELITVDNERDLITNIPVNTEITDIDVERIISRDLVANIPVNTEITDIDAIIHKDLIANIPVNTEITDIDVTGAGAIEIVSDISLDFSLSDAIATSFHKIELVTNIPVTTEITNVICYKVIPFVADIFKQVYPENDYYPGNLIYPGIADQYITSKIDMFVDIDHEIISIIRHTVYNSIINFKVEREFTANIPSNLFVSTINAKEVTDRFFTANIPVNTQTSDVEPQIVGISAFRTNLDINTTCSNIDLIKHFYYEANIESVIDNNEIKVEVEQGILFNSFIENTIDNSEISISVERLLAADIHKQTYPKVSNLPNNDFYPGLRDQFVCSSAKAIESTERTLRSIIRHTVKLSVPIAENIIPLIADIKNDFDISLVLCRNNYYFISNIVNDFITSNLDVQEVTETSLRTNILTNFINSNIEFYFITDFNTNIQSVINLSNIEAVEITGIPLVAFIENCYSITDISLTNIRQFKANIFRQDYPTNNSYPNNGFYPGLQDQFVCSKINAIEVTDINLRSTIRHTVINNNIDVSLENSLSATINNEITVTDIDAKSVKDVFLKADILKSKYPGERIFPNEVFYPGHEELFICSDVNIASTYSCEINSSFICSEIYIAQEKALTSNIQIEFNVNDIKASEITGIPLVAFIENNIDASDIEAISVTERFFNSNISIETSLSNSIVIVSRNIELNANIQINTETNIVDAIEVTDRFFNANIQINTETNIVDAFVIRYLNNRELLLQPALGYFVTSDAAAVVLREIKHSRRKFEVENIISLSNSIVSNERLLISTIDNIVTSKDIEVKNLHKFSCKATSILDITNVDITVDREIISNIEKEFNNNIIIVSIERNLLSQLELQFNLNTFNLYNYWAINSNINNNINVSSLLINIDREFNSVNDIEFNINDNIVISIERLLEFNKLNSLNISDIQIFKISELLNNIDNTIVINVIKALITKTFENDINVNYDLLNVDIFCYREFLSNINELEFINNDIILLWDYLGEILKTRIKNISDFSKIENVSIFRHINNNSIITRLLRIPLEKNYYEVLNKQKINKTIFRKLENVSEKRKINKEYFSLINNESINFKLEKLIDYKQKIENVSEEKDFPLIVINIQK